MSEENLDIRKVVANYLGDPLSGHRVLEVGGWRSASSS